MKKLCPRGWLRIRSRHWEPGLYVLINPRTYKALGYVIEDQFNSFEGLSAQDSYVGIVKGVLTGAPTHSEWEFTKPWPASLAVERVALKRRRQNE